MINYFKAAERVLLERGNFDRALANLERRLERAIKQNGPGEPQTIDFSRPYVSTAHTADALAACLEVVEIRRLITATKQTTNDTDDVLEQLPADDARILRAWYIEHKPKEQIAEEFCYNSRTSIYDLRNKAVSAFAILYYGSAALAST